MPNLLNEIEEGVLEKSISYLFPTPIGEFQIPQAEVMNPGLRREILEREQIEPSQAYANAGGWHSTKDLLGWGGQEIDMLHQSLLEAVKQMHISILQSSSTSPSATNVDFRAVAWANVSRFGHYHRGHNHPGSVWSGVYYVDPGGEVAEQPLSGVLELPDPRTHANMVPIPGDPFGQRALVQPKAGAMIVFPSWFQHAVLPYYGKGERISIAFNVGIAGASTT